MTQRNVTLAGIVLGLMLSTVLILAAPPADATATAPGATVTPAVRHTATVNVWQARKRHALELNRPDRARYVRHLSAHLRPCPMEDSRDCRWNGHTAGNGRGRSFVDLSGMTFYFNGQVRRYV